MIDTRVRLTRPTSTKITVAEAARRHSVSQRTSRRWVSQGLLTGYQCGPTMLRIDSDELEHLHQVIPTVANV